MEKLTIEHYVGECTLKCAQVILAARIPRKNNVEATERRSGRWVSCLPSSGLCTGRQAHH